MKSVAVGTYLGVAVFLSTALALDPHLLPPSPSPSQAKEKPASEKLTESLKQEPLGKKSLRIQGGPNHNQILQEQWSQDVKRQHEEIRRQRIPTH